MILDDTINLLRERYGGRLDQITLERVVVGVFFTGVKLSNGQAGISYTPVEDLQETHTCCPSMMHRSKPWFQGQTVAQFLAEQDPDALPRTVTTALVNALSRELIMGGGYRLVRNLDAMDLFNIESMGEISMVGAFIPYLKKFKAIDGIRFHVVEKKVERLKEDELKFFVPAEHAAEVLPGSDTVILTGATLANDTIDGLMGMIRDDALVIVIGPTASLIPDLFFQKRVALVSGSLVADPDRCVDAVAQGHDAHALFDGGFLEKINILNPSVSTGQPPYGDLAMTAAG